MQAGLFLLLASLMCDRALPADGYLPFRSEKPGHISDLVLIYQGGRHRLEWNADQLAAYVSWKPDDGPEQWLFDGFLFIEFKDGKRHHYSVGYGGSPARQQEWRWLLERNFSETNALGALDSVVGKVIDRIGPPAARRKVVLTMPEPIRGQTNWGSVAGTPLDFNQPLDRIAACEWHMDQALRLWREARFKNLDLAGFYWVAEQASAAEDILPEVARAIRKRGLSFYWIPYWNSRGAARWRELGFDYAWQQPNHFFHPGKVPDSRLADATAFAGVRGLGLEFEVDGRALTSPETFRPRFYKYLAAFTRDGVEASSSVAYYEGGGALLQMATSRKPEARAMYDDLCRWVTRRHGLKLKTHP